MHDKREVWDDYLDTCIYIMQFKCQTVSYHSNVWYRKPMFPIELERDVDDLFHQYAVCFVS